MRAHCTHRFSRQIFLYPLAEVIAAADGFNNVVATAVSGSTLKPHEGGGGVTLVTRDGVADSIAMWCCCKFNCDVVLLQIQLRCGVVKRCSRAIALLLRCTRHQPLRCGGNATSANFSAVNA
jgi:hypothetical protein